MTYLAYYENAAKVEAAAKARGFTGNDGESWHDFVESEENRFRVAKKFAALNKATDWLKAEIAATKSVYGCGTIIQQEPVAWKCRYCTCGGVRQIREYIVDDTGIVEDRAIESECLE